jgi:hypothetical protein
MLVLSIIRNKKVQIRVKAVVAQSVQRLSVRWMTGGRLSTRARDVSLRLRAPAGSRTHSASDPMRTDVSSLREMLPGHEADHSPPPTAEVKKE